MELHLFAFGVQKCQWFSFKILRLMSVDYLWGKADNICEFCGWHFNPHRATQSVLHLKSKLSDWLLWSLIEICTVHRGWVIMPLAIPWPFLYHHQQIKVFTYPVKFPASTRGMGKKFCTNIRGSKMMNPHDFFNLTLFFSITTTRAAFVILSD